MHSAIRKNAVAVITGAAVGIGYAIAQRLAKEEMKLVLLDRDAIALEEAKFRLKSIFPLLEISTVIGDISSNDTLEALYSEAVNLGDIGILVNNAAVTNHGGPWDNVEQWRTLMEVNFWSILKTQQRFIETLFNQTSVSAIINLGSKEGITTPPGNAAYSVSKAAIRVLTEQLAHELREYSQQKVTAHLLIPGYTFTPMNFPGTTLNSTKPAEPWSAEQVAERMIEGLNAGNFYIFCEDNEITRTIDERRMQWSMDDLILNRPALSRWHKDWRSKFAEYIKGA